MSFGSFYSEENRSWSRCLGKNSQKYHHLQMLEAIKADKTISPRGSTTRLKRESARHKAQTVSLMWMNWLFVYVYCGQDVAGIAPGLGEGSIIITDREGGKKCKNTRHSRHHKYNKAGLLIILLITDSDIYPLVHPLLRKNWLLPEECHYLAPKPDERSPLLLIHQMISPLKNYL